MTKMNDNTSTKKIMHSDFDFSRGKDTSSFSKILLVIKTQPHGRALGF